MSESVDFVDAFVAGQALRLRLDPSQGPIPPLSPMGSLQAAIGAPYAAFQRFLHAAWLPTDVGHILRHAWPGAKPLMGRVDCEAVDALMAVGRVATYAPLAHKLLEALLFGLAPERAVFDERAPFADAA